MDDRSTSKPTTAQSKRTVKPTEVVGDDLHGLKTVLFSAFLIPCDDDGLAIRLSRDKSLHH